jgi:HK97 family phage major capsid protein
MSGKTWLQLRFGVTRRRCRNICKLLSDQAAGSQGRSAVAAAINQLGDFSFMTIREMKSKREDYLRTSRSILDKATAENRQLTDAEKKDWDGLMAKANAFSDTLKRSSEVNDLLADLGRPSNSAIPLTSNGMQYSNRAHREGEVRMYQPKEAMAQGPYQGPGIGSPVRGICTGKWDGATELRDMVGGTPAAGGYLVPTPLSTQVIDLMRNQAQVVNAGAVSVAMDSSTLKMARLASDVTSAWKSENAALTYADNTFEQVTFTAHTLMAGAKLSIEVVEDAYNIDGVVSDSIAKSLALELDRAALYGTGVAPMPKGVKVATGVTVTDLGTNGLTPVDYSTLSAGISTLLGANFPGPFGMIYSARTAGELDALQDTLKQPLREPASVAAAGKFISNQVPNNITHGSSSTTSDIFIGQWNQLAIGMRTGLTLEISREAGDATTSAFSNGQVWIRAYLRADVQPLHPKAFNVLTGVL